MPILEGYESHIYTLFYYYKNLFIEKRFIVCLITYTEKLNIKQIYDSLCIANSINLMIFFS
jgi:hypothetical protein